jgi:hypothetical protein
MMRWLTIVSMMVVLSFGSVRMIAASPSSDEPVVVLTGVVKSKTEWGPPGFGETAKVDGKFVIFTLKLVAARTGKQLSLPEDAKDRDKKFAELQLRCDSSAFPACEGALKRSLGHRVTVGGQVERAAAPTDYLPIILRVRLITNR